MTTDHAASLEFLRALRPTGFWLLSAIHPLIDGDIETRPFAVSEGDAVLAWLERWNQTHNIYFSVNPSIRMETKKAKRDNIASMEFVHVDIDPRHGQELESERARALALLTTTLPTGVPPPTFVIDSGGGAWGLWRLTEPLPINGESSRYEEATRFNLQLELLFGADSCHNVDRICRLPGTINWPNKKKIDRGQTPRLATLLECETRETYPLSRFTPAPLVQGDGTDLGGYSVEISTGNIKRLESVDELPATVSKRCRMVIQQGTDLDNPDKWSSRSEPLFWVCCELVRADVTDDVIFSILTDPGFGISESVRDKGSRAEKYAIRQIERAREEAIHPKLRELNEKHAVIGDISGKCRIVSETWDDSLKRICLSYQSFQDFHNRYSNDFVEVANGDKVQSMPLGLWWTRHKRRRSYEHVVFAPGRETPGVYNLWKGFSCDAKPGDCSKLLAHVFDNICCKDENLYRYLLGWMARAVQTPDEQGHVSIVMQGLRGVGKGVFAQCFGKLFGRHFLPITNSEHLVGKFNEHLRDCVVLFADEAFYAGDKRHESMLKTLITEDTIMSEAKGVNAGVARNFVHLLMASNDSWVIPAGASERRFLMLKVSTDHLQDKPYFAAIDREYENGGKEALLHYLMNYNLAGYEPRDVPKTEALQEQKRHSFSPMEEWWYTKLERGTIFDGEEWPDYVVCTHLAHDFTVHMQTWKSNSRANSTQLGHFVMSVLPNGEKCKAQLSGAPEVVGVDGELKKVHRPRVYRVASLEECRKHFADKFIGGDVDWSETLETVSNEYDGFF